MIRTLSVAGSLAILIFALWIVQLAKVTTPAYDAAPQATDASAPVAKASADAVATAVDDLAGWPVAAGR
jgi:hypothetical protein